MKTSVFFVLSVTQWEFHLLEKTRLSTTDTWSDRVEGTTVDAEEAILVEDVELRKAELGTWTTLVTVIVCLMLFVADCFVTAAPSDGRWFSWFKTNVVVDGWGLFCWWQRQNLDCDVNNSAPTATFNPILKQRYTKLKAYERHPDTKTDYRSRGWRLVSDNICRLCPNANPQGTDGDRLEEKQKSQRSWIH